MSNQQLFADKPLTNPEDDKLNYAPFAKHLAKSISKMMPPDGLVIGLYGAWGSGKSTLIEFVVHELNDMPDNERPIIIRFNPWWFSGQENLTRHFFEHLYASIDNNFEKGMKSLVKSLKNFSDIIVELPVPDSGIAKSLSSKISDSSTRDVNKVKSQIASKLRARKQKLLIIIDDIDRLNPDEIRQLFTLIKSVADFPNIVYLLAFDKDVVANAIGASYASNVSGDDFLEKIVQVPFELPVPSHEDLIELFLEKLKKSIGELPERFSNKNNSVFQGYISYLDSLITNTRDIHRFVNSFSVTYSAVKGEVDLTDFLAIEMLRVFRPNIYSAIKVNKRLFTQSLYHNPRETLVSKLLNSQPEYNERLSQLISAMFPRVSKSQDSYVDYVELRKQLRIGVYELFDTYFRYTVQPSNVSTQEVVDYIMAPPEDKINHLLEMFSSNFSRSRLFLDRLADFRESIHEDAAEQIIAAFLTVGDEIQSIQDRQQSFVMKLSPVKFDLVRLIISLFENLTESNRYAILHNVDFSNTLFLTFYTIAKSQGFYESNSNGTEILKPEKILSLESRMMKILFDAINSSYNQTSDFYSVQDILMFWVQIRPQEAEKWVKQRLKTAKDYANLLKGYIVMATKSIVVIADELYLLIEKDILIKRVHDFLNDTSLDKESKTIFNLYMTHLEQSRG
jgi:predicted KAP-like P-loop ATPase